MLLPEDEPHDVVVFDAAPGYFRDNSPAPAPSNAPPAPTWYIGRASDLCVGVECVLRHRLVTVGGTYGSGKSALAAAAAAYLGRRGHFEAVVWVKATTRDRLFDDIHDAAARVIDGRGNQTSARSGRVV